MRSSWTASFRVFLGKSATLIPSIGSGRWIRASMRAGATSNDWPPKVFDTLYGESVAALPKTAASPSMKIVGAITPGSAPAGTRRI